jgi:hypothetical protein
VGRLIDQLMQSNLFWGMVSMYEERLSMKNAVNSVYSVDDVSSVVSWKMRLVFPFSQKVMTSARASSIDCRFC